MHGDRVQTGIQIQRKEVQGMGWDGEQNGGDGEGMGTGHVGIKGMGSGLTGWGGDTDDFHPRTGLYCGPNKQNTLHYMQCARKHCICALCTDKHTEMPQHICTAMFNNNDYFKQVNEHMN